MPRKAYTADDLYRTTPVSRSNVEMKDKSCRPPIIDPYLHDAQSYDRIFAGFPLWWHLASTVVKTFLESLYLEWKNIISFAASDSIGMGNTFKELIPSA